MFIIDTILQGCNRYEVLRVKYPCDKRELTRVTSGQQSVLVQARRHLDRIKRTSYCRSSRSAYYSSHSAALILHGDVASNLGPAAEEIASERHTFPELNFKGLQIYQLHMRSLPRHLEEVKLLTWADLGFWLGGCTCQTEMHRKPNQDNV